MTRTGRARRPFALLLGLVILGLASALVLPHQHTETSLAHQAEACRVCKLHEGFAAATGLDPLPLFTGSLVVLARLAPLRAPVTRLARRSFSSRAPPFSA